MPQAAFPKWLAGTTEQPQPGGGVGTAPAVIFTKNGCGACHTFSAIPSAQGKVGPSLDNLSEAAKAAGMPLEDFIHQSIVDPGAYVAEGYVAGTMPSFEGTIPADKLDQLVQYLAENTK
jgi:cytochrome c551/c552